MPLQALVVCVDHVDDEVRLRLHLVLPLLLEESDREPPDEERGSGEREHHDGAEDDRQLGTDKCSGISSITRERGHLLLLLRAFFVPRSSQRRGARPRRRLMPRPGGRSIGRASSGARVSRRTIAAASRITPPARPPGCSPPRRRRAPEHPSERLDHVWPSPWIASTARPAIPSSVFTTTTSRSARLDDPRVPNRYESETKGRLWPREVHDAPAILVGTLVLGEVEALDDGLEGNDERLVPTPTLSPAMTARVSGRRNVIFVPSPGRSPRRPSPAAR